jgi:hypothetical protein
VCCSWFIGIIEPHRTGEIGWFFVLGDELRLGERPDLVQQPQPVPAAPKSMINRAAGVVAGSHSRLQNRKKTADLESESAVQLDLKNAQGLKGMKIA